MAKGLAKTLLGVYIQYSTDIEKIYVVDNFIDGAALALLPDDFTEFSHLVPQSGLRMKLKAAIDRLCDSSITNKVNVSDCNCIVPHTIL